MLTIDSSQVLSFALQLQGTPKYMRPALRRSIIDAADVIAARARSNASWSTRIPGAIRTRVHFGSRNAVHIVVDQKKAPHARAFEGIGQRGETFRHPVFGRDAWVEQSQRPFLMPAVQSSGQEAVDRIQEVISSAFDRLG